LSLLLLLSLLYTIIINIINRFCRSHASAMRIWQQKIGPRCIMEWKLSADFWSCDLWHVFHGPYWRLGQMTRNRISWSYC